MTGGGNVGMRGTFNWAKATLADPPVALAHRLIAIRRRYAALRTGSFITLITDNAQRVYAFGRFDANHRIAVVLNDSGSDQAVHVPVWQLSDVNGSKVKNLLTDRTYPVVDGEVAVTVNGYSGMILEQ